LHLVRNIEVGVQVLSINGIALVAPDVSPCSSFVSVFIYSLLQHACADRAVEPIAACRFLARHGHLFEL
jgi:hypothetical protein